MSYPIEEITSAQYLELVNKEHDINVTSFLPRCIKFGNSYFVYANSEYGKLISESLSHTAAASTKELNKFFKDKIEELKTKFDKNKEKANSYFSAIGGSAMKPGL